MGFFTPAQGENKKGRPKGIREKKGGGIRKTGKPLESLLGKRPWLSTVDSWGVG